MSILNTINNLFAHQNTYSYSTQDSTTDECENCANDTTPRTEGSSYKISFTDPNSIHVNAKIDGTTYEMTLVEEQAKLVHDFITSIGSLPFPPLTPFQPFIAFASPSTAESLLNNYQQDLEAYSAQKSEYAQRYTEYKEKNNDLFELIKTIAAANAAKTESAPVTESVAETVAETIPEPVAAE